MKYYLELKGENPAKRKFVRYCRVSNNKQKYDLERQIENVKSYMIAKGYSFDVVQTFLFQEGLEKV